MLAAIQFQYAAGDKASGVAGQGVDGLGDLIRLAHTRNQQVVYRRLQLLLVVLFQASGADGAGGHGIDADAERHPFIGHGFTQVDQPGRAAAEWA
jgi:hypothetical protein